MFIYQRDPEGIPKMVNGLGPFERGFPDGLTILEWMGWISQAKVKMGFRDLLERSPEMFEMFEYLIKSP